MGYYTHFGLTIIEGDTNNGLIAKLRDENDNAAYCFDEEGNAEEGVKWYEHQTDLRAFSQKHPKALFKLTGEGEESGDVWIEYYRDGKMQECVGKISYDEFDESKLN